MSLYHKYAFTDLDDLVGNEDAIATIRSHFEQPQDKWSHAWMIHGPAGCGKGLLANIIATKYLGGIPDLTIIENNTGSSRGIDAFRELYRKVQSKPLGGGNWVVIVNEAQGLTNDARDSLLVPLEKAANTNVFYIFCSTSPESLYKGKEGEAFSTRLTKIAVKPVGEKEMYRFLRRIAKLEAVQIPENVLKCISEVCEGSCRSALTYLDMVLTLTDEAQMIRLIMDTPDTEQEPALIEFCRALMEDSYKDAAEKLRVLKGTMEPEKIRHGVMGYYASVGLSGKKRAAKIMDCFRMDTYSNGFPMLVLELMKAYDLE